MRCGAVVVLAACGRLGFDPTAGGDASGGPDAHIDSYVQAAVQLAPDGVKSFVDLEVDWARSIAYVVTRESGKCFAAIDFAVVPPAIIARLDPPATSGDRCLGVALVNNNTSVIVTSEAGNAVELWSLGSDPRAGVYTRVDVELMAEPRRLAAATGANTFFVTRGNSAPGFQVVTLATTTNLVGGNTYSGADCPNGYNALTHLATGLVLTACSEDRSPVELVDDTTLALGGSQPADNGGISGFWSAARTNSGDLAIMGGWVSAAFTTGAGGWTLLSRWDNADTYRDVVVIEPSSGTRYFAAATSDRHLELVEPVASGGAVVRSRAPLGTSGEGYGIEVDLATQRAVVITNGGWFLIVDLTRLPASSLTWPAF